MRRLILLFLILAPCGAFADSINFDLGSAPNVTSRIIQMIGLITILSLAPSILMMVTSFTRIVVVFSFLRTALGLQQSPPNTVLISLALFLTFFIMAPTFEESYKLGIDPLLKQKITEVEALDRMSQPFAKFMLTQTRQKDIELFYNIAGTETKNINYQNVPLRILTPAFMISELRKAFEIGFLLYIPFIVIDILISSVLMAMGMMMLPPVVISLPFKLVFFVLMDGWYMICGSLVKSFGG